jgi:hypothetical protein
MPLLRCSYITEMYDNEVTINGKIQSQNFSCIRTDMDIDPLNISSMGDFKPQDVSVTDYGEYNTDKGQTYGYCNINYKGRSIEIIRISELDYLKLKDHWINKLPNYPLDKPYEWHENI